MRAKWIMGFGVLAVGAAAAVLPVNAGVRPGLDAVLARWDHDEHPDLRGVVVIRGGRRVAERYYNGASARELHDIRSAGKSVTALLVGIAMDRGAIRSVDDPVAGYWVGAADSPIGSVPLRCSDDAIGACCV
jgi:CubicO group peptidase (beta-lactamase class C family)